MKSFSLMVPTTPKNWQGPLKAPYISSMSDISGTDTTGGSFVLEYEEYPLGDNVGWGRLSELHPSSNPIFEIQILTFVRDETLTLIWVSLKTLNL